MCAVFSISCDLCLKLNGTILFMYCMKIKKIKRKGGGVGGGEGNIISQRVLNMSLSEAALCMFMS